MQKYLLDIKSTKLKDLQYMKSCVIINSFLIQFLSELPKMIFFQRQYIK